MLRKIISAALVTTPYLFMYDMVVLAIPIAFLVRIGLRSGFRAYELPALAGAVALAPVAHACTGMICDILHIRLAEMR